MNWKQKIIAYSGQKYLGEIVHEIVDYYKKRPRYIKADQALSIPQDVSVLFMPAEVNSFPPPLREMIGKGYLQCTFMTDQAQKDTSTKERESLTDISSAEIKRTSEVIAEHEVHTVLPALDNFLFREGMTKKEFTWYQMLGILKKLPQLHATAEIQSFLQLENGKILYWDRDFLNMNHRHPELYRIYEYSKELRPDKDGFCRTFQCSKVIINRHPPFSTYFLISIPATAGIIVAFQE